MLECTKVQLEIIFLDSITCHLRKDTDIYITASSFQAGYRMIRSPLPLFLQTEQPHCPQSLIICLVSQLLHKFCCSLKRFQQFYILLVVRSSKLDMPLTLHFLKKNQPSRTPLPFSTTLKGILANKSQIRPKPVIWKSSVAFL